MPIYACCFLLFLVLVSVTCMTEYFGWVQLAESPVAWDWVTSVVGEGNNPAAGVVLLRPGFMTCLGAMWAIVYVFLVGLFITPWDVRASTHRQILAILSLLFICYAVFELFRTLGEAIDYYGWGFVLLATSEMLWVVTIGWSVALVICQCRLHIAWLLQRSLPRSARDNVA